MSSWNKKKRKRVGWNKNKSTIPHKKKKHNFDGSSNDNNNLWLNPESCLSWLVSNNNKNNLKDFLTNYWCKKPYLLKRKNKNYYKCKGIDIDLNTVYKIIEKHDGTFTFGENIICKYYNKQTGMQTNAVERGEIVKLNEIKKLFNDKANGATIQFLHSHFYHYEIGHLIFNLESYFGNFVSSNIYVTPNNKQGLKPHWDDIEAFILQIVGEKRWKIYKLNQENDTFPIKQSYKNLNMKNQKKYSLIMDCILSPGDLLYFPRGAVHFAQCVNEKENENNYCLHLTISTNQNNHYGEFIKLMVNNCLDEMIKNDVNLRQNIPINMIQSIGNELNINDNNLNEIQILERDKFKKNIYDFLKKLKTNIFDNNNGNNVFVDKAMDNMAIQFISKRYPPLKFLKPNNFIIYGKQQNQQRKEKIIEMEMKKKDELIDFIEENEKRSVIISGDSLVRLVDPNWMRFVNVNDIKNYNLDFNENENEDEKMIDSFLQDGDDEEVVEDQERILVYSCVGNNHKTHLMAYNEADIASEPMLANANDKMIFYVLNKRYPKWIKVSELEEKCDKCDGKRISDLLFALWADGLVETDQHK